MSTHTVLAPGEQGVIKCRDCGRTFPAHSAPSGRGGGRTGWEMLRRHVTQCHPETATALARGLADFDRANSLIVAEGRALCARAGRDVGAVS